MATDEEIEGLTEKLILGCKGDIPTLIKVVGKMEEKHPEHKVFFESVQAGLKRAIGKVS